LLSYVSNICVLTIFALLTPTKANPKTPNPRMVATFTDLNGKYARDVGWRPINMNKFIKLALVKGHCSLDNEGCIFIFITSSNPFSDSTTRFNKCEPIHFLNHKKSRIFRAFQNATVCLNLIYEIYFLLQLLIMFFIGVNRYTTKNGFKINQPTNFK